MGNWRGLAFASAFYMLGFGGFLVEVVTLPSVTLGPVVVDQVQFAAFVAGAVFVAVNYVGAKETGCIALFFIDVRTGLVDFWSFNSLFSVICLLVLLVAATIIPIPDNRRSRRCLARIHRLRSL